MLWGRYAAVLVAAGVVLSAPAGAQPDDPLDEDWVALAIAPGHSGGGYGVAGTAENATAIAMGECQANTGATCITAEIIRHGCVAYATQHADGTGSWSTASGPDPLAAETAAGTKLPPDSWIQFTQCWNPG